MHRGQVSVETLVAFIVVLIFFVIVLTQNSIIQQSGEIFSETYLNKGVCLGVAYALSETYASGTGTIMQFELERDVTINGSLRMVLIGQEQCQILARVNNATLTKGTIEIKNVDGVVSATQVV